MEITERIERLPAVEQKMGLSFEALYATFDRDDYQVGVTVNCDVIGASASLSSPVQVVVGVYNKQDQLVGTEAHLISDSAFAGIDSISVHVETHEAPARLRIYPKPLY
ncbi:hypothetical protein [Gordonia sp. 'Campus']|uniref:hypothetical protein n=1 Tax=Gordonia sp. 'Campus' TaxID=2915824 RepID=UPI001EE42B87|nr:hypothetical protein [Gordonia sp. 'Campus']